MQNWQFEASAIGCYAAYYVAKLQAYLFSIYIMHRLALANNAKQNHLLLMRLQRKVTKNGYGLSSFLLELRTAYIISDASIPDSKWHRLSAPIYLNFLGSSLAAL
jgi:hypothetical protein